MGQLAKVFEVNTKAINITRGLLVVVAMAIPWVVMKEIGLERYWLSLVFGLLFVALSDPGGKGPTAVTLGTRLAAKSASRKRAYPAAQLQLRGVRRYLRCPPCRANDAVWLQKQKQN